MALKIGSLVRLVRLGIPVPGTVADPARGPADALTRR